MNFISRVFLVLFVFIVASNSSIAAQKNLVRAPWLETKLYSAPLNLTFPSQQIAYVSDASSPVNSSNFRGVNAVISYQGGGGYTIKVDAASVGCLALYGFAPNEVSFILQLICNESDLHSGLAGVITNSGISKTVEFNVLYQK